MKRILLRSQPSFIIWIAPALFLCLLMGGSARAVHLGRVPPCVGACIDEESLDHVVAAAMVEVVLGKSKETKVILQKWILEPEAALDLTTLKPSACIPDRAQLSSMLKPSKGVSYVYLPAIKAAIKSGRYSLILFFGRSRAGEIQPECALEIAINWDGFPIFARRLQWLVKHLTGEEHCLVSGVQTHRQFAPADQLEPVVVAEGECKDGLKDGLWRFDLGAGYRETGEFKWGKRIGPWVLSDSDVRETVSYRDGRKNGRYERLLSGRMVEEGFFKNGLRTGTWRTWHTWSQPGTPPDEVQYRDGVRQ